MTFVYHKYRHMSLEKIENYIQQLPAISQQEYFGYRFFFYGTEQVLPFVTITLSDNEHDNISQLDREGIFRVNIGVSRERFAGLFGENNHTWDYTQQDVFMPHPHYAAQHFICVLNPEEDRLSATLDYIQEAYTIAKNRFERKQPKS